MEHKHMHYRKFGSTGFKVSEVGLGTWQFGGDWGDIAEQDARAILKSALECGINFFDTADVYGSGRSETFIGSFLQDVKEKVFVATKLGRFGGYPDKYSFDFVKKCTENSLRRLKKEVIDLTQLHCVPRKLLESGEIFDWLRKLQKEGKIRHFGASVETIDEAFLCLKQDGLTSLQIIFNIFRQKPMERLFAEAVSKDVALIVRLPLASGLLSGKFTKTTTFGPRDHRNYNRDGQKFNVGETFSGLEFQDGVELVDEIKTFVPSNITMAQFALRWILDYPEVSVIIPGASKTEQVVSNASASDIDPLEKDMHLQLHHIYKEKIESQIRGLV
jgi:aryl-alcohol dehydrogenase-like predicted oxidoreductase